MAFAPGLCTNGEMYGQIDKLYEGHEQLLRVIVPGSLFAFGTYY